MTHAARYGLIFAGIGIGAKLALFSFLPHDKAQGIAVMTYLLCLILAIVAGFRAEIREVARPTSFREQFRWTFLPACWFALIISAFAFSYYEWVNPAYFEARIDEVVARAEAADMETAVPKDHPLYGITKEELVEKERALAENFTYNPTMHAGLITLLPLVAAGGIFSFLIVILFRRVKAFRQGLIS